MGRGQFWFATSRRAGGAEEIASSSPKTMAPELCRMIAKVTPELDAYLVTERSVEDIAVWICGICRRVFYTQEDFYGAAT